jgi:peroxiredoxin
MHRVPDALRAYYEKLGIEIGLRHGGETWFLPIPATFVVGRNGIVRYVHASGDVTDRMEPDDIVARVREAASI